MHNSTRKFATALYILVAIIGAVVAVYGFITWSHAGFPFSGTVSPKNDGSLAAVFIGLAASLGSLLTLAMQRRSGDDSEDH
jgi:hypothetical protein